VDIEKQKRISKNKSGNRKLNESEIEGKQKENRKKTERKQKENRKKTERKQKENRMKTRLSLETSSGTERKQDGQERGTEIDRQ